MKIRSIECFKVNLPFKHRFVISHSERLLSESVILKITLENGTIGWGECLPRAYVTGESQDSVIEILKSKYSKKCSHLNPCSYEEVYHWLERFKPSREECSAFCALDLAVLDAYGNLFKRSVSTLLPGTGKRRVLYSATISLVSGIELVKVLLLLKMYSMKRVKVKVGRADDSRRLSLIRKVLGNDVDIRLDANQAWDVNKTLENIQAWSKIGISGIEQPVRTSDEIMRIVKRTNMPIIVDESLCTLKDAKKYKKVIFDIRLSKCAGISQSRKIYEYALEKKEERGLSCQLGCHVGESGILTAAGRHFAFAMENIEYLEGSYNGFLLKEDLTFENMTFGRKGYAGPVKGTGLGITVDDERVRRFSVGYEMFLLL